MKILASAFSVIVAALSVPAAASPAGEWRVADGSANVAIHACGDNYCGSISWTKDGALVGAPVLIAMRPSGNAWAGSIVNARNGQKYTGRISLRTEAVLNVEGCVLGGALCGGQHWSRLK